MHQIVYLLNDGTLLCEIIVKNIPMVGDTIFIPYMNSQCRFKVTNRILNHTDVIVGGTIEQDKYYIVIEFE